MSSNPVKEVVNNGNKKKGEVESRNNFPIHELIETAVRAHFRIVRYTMTKFENRVLIGKENIAHCLLIIFLNQVSEREEATSDTDFKESGSKTMELVEMSKTQNCLISGDVNATFYDEKYFLTKLQIC